MTETNAVDEMERHRARLIEAPRYRATDAIVAARLANRVLCPLNTVVHAAGEYVFIYASDDSLSPYDLLDMEDEERREELAQRIEERLAGARAAIDRRSWLFLRLHEEWTRRFAEPLRRTKAETERTGPADEPTSAASREPLVVWICEEDPSSTWGGKLPPGVTGYHDPATGWVFLTAARERNALTAALERAKALHEGTHQLHRRSPASRRRPPSQSWIDEGLAELLAGTRLDAEGRLEFTDVNVARLRGMQGMARALLARRLPQHEPFRARGPGTYHRHVDPRTGELARPEIVSEEE